MNDSRPKKTAGFTLIELLIVVAIIAILAAIAVPNFLEAQVRAKVSRVREDARSLALALEAYFTDYNTYPQMYARHMPENTPSVSAGIALSTPVAYISNAQLRDPFAGQETDTWMSFLDIITNNENDYQSCMNNQHVSYIPGNYTWNRNCYMITSPGPDRVDSCWNAEYPWCIPYPPGTVATYDASNGTISNGEVYRTHTERRVKGHLLPLTGWLPAGEDPYF